MVSSVVCWVAIGFELTRCLDLLLTLCLSDDLDTDSSLGSELLLVKHACCCMLPHVYELFFPLRDEMPEILSLHDYHIYWGHPFLFGGNRNLEGTAIAR